MKKIFYFMMAVAFLIGCTETPGEEFGNIHGTVTDKATGELIRSAGIQLNPVGIKAVTGNDGQYEFTDLKVGEYTLQVTKTGYKDLLNHKITVVAGINAQGNVQLEKLPPSLRVVNDSKQDISELNFGDAIDDVTRSFNIFNDGPESLEWEITATANWITGVSRASGRLNAVATQAIVITIDRTKLNSGNNTTTIHLTSDNGSKQLTVNAIGETFAELNTLDLTNITSSSATLNGEILNSGIPAYTERGFVYSLSSMPTLQTTIAKVTASLTTSNTYSATISGLAIEQTYYVRAYAINIAGTAYSANEMNFKTAMSLPEVTTQNVTNIDAVTATFNGIIVSMGDPVYTERGFVYGLVHNPTIESDIKKAAFGTEIGAFSSNLTGLTTGNLYYVRAYATNVRGTAYGTEVSFTPSKPEYIALSAAGIMVQTMDITSDNISWISANNLCKNSIIGGYIDWRLPTLNELGTIYNNKTIIGGFKADYQSGAYYYFTYYWTSTANGNKYNAIYFRTGEIESADPYSSSNYSRVYYGRCVRTIP